ncbi:hypothetical protein EOD41_08710 [Mucilaginibacter limnophilus]|uniref:Uncharacterized protein n=1 Tax=Mucilaginibacter limnophilus TaxID=1932778 RepID=A0A437MWH3_9SPHI|nr:hypothetical protein [Mucilaginibacter limnophilus]RVU02021.1 hypothetical protein EOD41_08710 [Mucilaginibacter limnophilus]
MENPAYVFEYLIIKDASKKCYYEKTTIGDSIWTQIYIRGVAVMLHTNKVDTLHSKIELEEPHLQSHILPDMEFEKLGYKLNLIGLHKFKNFDCYGTKITSPAGKGKQISIVRIPDIL